jgi:dienelactone hydrolase
MHFVHLLVAAALVGSSGQLNAAPGLAAPGLTEAAEPSAVAGATDGQANAATDDASSAAAKPAAKAARANDGQRVEFAADDKYKLVGSYYAPKDPKKPSPAALLVPDADGKRVDLSELADKLQKQGFAVLTVDVRGHGDSVILNKDLRAKAWAEMTDEEKLASWKQSLGDVKAAVKFLATQPGVDKVRLSLLGDRAGCTLVTSHAKSDENVRSVVMLDPPSAETLGFNLQNDVVSLSGLPTMIAVTDEAQDKAKAIKSTGEKANNGLDYIQVSVFKVVSLAPVIDRKLPGAIADFMEGQANPKKGK